MSDFFQTDDSNKETEETETKETNFVSTLVNEKGDAWSNPETIAKGYIHAEKHIKSLERQVNELVEDLEKNKYAEKLLEKIQKPAEPTTGETIGGDVTEKDPSVTPDQIKTLIAETLTEREITNSKAKNLSEANKLLSESFGTEAEAKVLERAKELGLSKDRLQSIAEESPTAFMALIGKPVIQNNEMKKETVNTAASFLNSSSSKRTFSDYQKIRKENPKLYYSPKIQQQMEKDYAEMGESFMQ